MAAAAAEALHMSADARTDFAGMPEALLRRALDVLVRAGKAQVFGGADGEGVKFV